MQSAGFSRHYDQGWRTWLTWPLWEVPASVETVQALLCSVELQQGQPRLAELRKRGVVAAFRSLRQPIGTKGYAILKPATLVG